MQVLEEKLFEAELRLAEKLKRDYCDQSGKETNPAKAAEILLKIGLIYRKRSPDKIALIKCVGLLNASIIRNPFNVYKVRSELFEVCGHILQQANAKIESLDFVKKAVEVKNSFNELRSKVKTLLRSSAAAKIPADAKNENLFVLETNKISAIQHINNFIANKYKQIMADLSQFCENVMGKPPCAYSIVGMGSLARKEITPYSDFEHIILLCDDKNYESYLKYFRWYSVIFHTLILNMQETIIPSLNIKCLNDAESPFGNWYFDAYTPRGISFDGMMPHACKFPLGRTDFTKLKPWTIELIKPVSEMLKYLGSEAELKNGYHLADILTKTCFVFGGENLFQQFTDGASIFRKRQTKNEVIEEVKKQVKEDLNNFSTRFRLSNFKSYDTINIKQLVYRSSTIFISALARVNNVLSNSSFDVINEMARNNQITQNMAHHLLFAIAIACEMRLRVYMGNKSQCDNAIDLKKDGIEKFLDIVGFQCTISYFQIAYCLQCKVAKELQFTKLYFYSDPQLVNITIGFAFNVLGEFKFSAENDELKIAWNLLGFDFDACMEQLQNSNWVYDVTKSSERIDLKSMESLANYLYKAQVYDEALEFFSQILIHYQSKSINENADTNVARTYYRISFCLAKMQQFDKTLYSAKQSLKIYQSLSLDQERDCEIAKCLRRLGYYQVKLNQYNDALTCLKQSLVIQQNISSNVKEDREFAGTLVNYADCLRNQSQFDDALKYHKQALQIFQVTSCHELDDDLVATARNNIGLCLKDMKKFVAALEHFKLSLKIMENVSRDKKKDAKVAKRLFNIGLCLSEMYKFNDALKYFKQSLEIYRNRSLDEQKDYNVAQSLSRVGSCLLEMQNYKDALNYLQESLDNFKQLPPSEKNTSITA